MAARKKKPTSDMQIVIATITVDQEPVGTWRWDLGEHPKMRDVLVAKAMMWIRKGGPLEEQEAGIYAQKNSDADKIMTVHVFPQTEKDPLGKAKAEALKVAGSRNRSGSTTRLSRRHKHMWMADASSAPSSKFKCSLCGARADELQRWNERKGQYEPTLILVKGRS